MSSKTPKSNFLAIRLKSRDGHCGRKGKEIQRLSAATGLSVHMLQSLALGRRAFTEDTKAAVRKALSDA